MYAYFSNSVFKKFSRVFLLSLVSTVYALVFDKVFGSNIGILSSIAIQIVPLIGLEGFSLTKAVIPLIPVNATLLITERNVLRTICIGSIAWFTLFLLDYAILLIVARRSVNGFSSVELGTLFLRNRLIGDRGIEGVFNKLSSTIRVNPCLLLAGDTLMVYTDLHYGPWGDVGSGSLPSILTSRLRGRGYKVIVLHGAGSHERNLATRGETISFIEKIEDSLRNLNGFAEEKFYGFFTLKGGDGWELVGLVFDKTSLFFVSRSGGGIDDLPYDLQIFANGIFKNINERCIIIDSHNWELERQPNFSELYGLINRSLSVVEDLKKRNPCILQTRSMCSESTGSNGFTDFCVIEFTSKCMDKPFILLYFRGNNMVKGLRDELKDVVKNAYGGEVYVEVLTNDEHTYTGVYAFQIYTPIKGCKELLQAVANAVSKLRELNYTHGFKTMCFEDEARVMGESAYKLAELLDKSFVKTTVLLLTYVFVSPLLLKMLFNII